MQTLTLNSYAKLNLYLEVLNKRKDRYHNIRTVFEKISLCDKIILKNREDGKISLTCDNPHLPKDNSNLAFRSAKLIKDSLKISKGVDIHIIKRIPVAAGLGGGSSNAAAVLLGLNRLWRLGICEESLVDYAKELGCDVPFFIYNCSFAEGIGRGDTIKPLRRLDNLRLWHVLVVPKNRVKTPEIYKRWDNLKKEYQLLLKNRARLNKKDCPLIYLTVPRYDVKILFSALEKHNLDLAKEALFNSLEQVSAKICPQIRQIKERLMRLGAKSTLMSGSGSSVFAIVSSKNEALCLHKKIQSGINKANRSWQVFVTQTTARRSTNGDK